jgi:hypothetical protein
MRRPYWLVALAACATAPAPVTHADEADAIRAEMVEADVVKRGFLLDELAKVELRRAQAAHTPAAYRHFLAEFPAGEEATAARALLEGLEFERAERVGTQAAWGAFLDEFPRGRRAAEGRSRLAALVVDEALASPELALVRRALARYPEAPRRALLVEREDDLSWKAVARDDRDALRRFLAEHPSTRHHAEATEALDALDRQDLRATLDLERARARAAQSDASDADRNLVAELEWSLASARLDLAALARVGQGGGPFSARAAALAESLQKNPLSVDLSAAVDAARPGAGLPPRERLDGWLRSDDPQERATAVAYVAERADPADLEAVLAAAESRYVVVRLAALEALRGYASALSPAAWRAFAQGREADAFARALSAPMWRKVALLRDASGRTDAALTAWAEVARADSDDLVARARLLALQRKVGDRLGVNAAARELARLAVSFADGRWLQPPDAAAPPEHRRDGPGQRLGARADVPVLRQLCVALDLAEAAAAALRELRPQAAAAEQELVGLAVADTERALATLRGKQAELERREQRADPSFVPCHGHDPAPMILAARAGRLAAVRVIAASRDARLAPFVRGLAQASDPALRALALETADALEAR